MTMIRWLIALTALLMMPAAAAFSAESSSFLIGSFHTGVAGNDAQSTTFSIGTSSDYNQGTSSGESTTYSMNVGWFQVMNAPAAAVSAAAAILGGGHRVRWITKRIESCMESWVCEEWGPCVNGTRARICYDVNECGTRERMPSMEQACIPAPEKSAGEQAPITGRAVHPSEQKLERPAPGLPAGLIILAFLLVAILILIGTKMPALRRLRKRILPSHSLAVVRSRALRVFLELQAAIRNVSRELDERFKKKRKPLRYRKKYPLTPEERRWRRNE